MKKYATMFLVFISLTHTQQLSTANFTLCLLSNYFCGIQYLNY